MYRRTARFLMFFATILLNNALAADSGSVTTISKKTDGILKESDFSDVLIDSSAGSVSASGMLGIPGEAITPIENVKGLVVAANGISSGPSKTGLGISIAPWRTSMLPMDLSTYLNGDWPMRLLSSFTFGFAQGTSPVANKDYERQAYSADVSLIFLDEDDPVVAYAKALEHCKIFSEATPPSPDNQGGSFGGAPKKSEEEGKITKANANACRASVLKNIRWNRSQMAVSVGTGWIGPVDGSKNQESLGRTIAASLVYGFDGISRLDRKAAVYLTLRHTADDPDLSTLQSATTIRKNSSLGAIRLAAGSDTARALIEISNAKSSGAASQQVFKNAVGIDYRLADNLWLNFRWGHMRKIDGTGTELGSLFKVSYSPSQILKF